MNISILFFFSLISSAAQNAKTFSINVPLFKILLSLFQSKKIILCFQKKNHFQNGTNKEKEDNSRKLSEHTNNNSETTKVPNSKKISITFEKIWKMESINFRGNLMAQWSYRNLFGSHFKKIFPLIIQIKILDVPGNLFYKWILWKIRFMESRLHGWAIC